MKTILVIDDEVSIQNLLKISLEPHEFAVLPAATALDGLKLSGSHPEITAILLDLGLPDGSGMELLKKIRATGSKTPIIVVTVIDNDHDKVTALDLGADDYVTKPFSIPELLARIRVAIRHTNTNQMGQLIKTGELEVDIQSHQVRVRNNEIKLTPLEFQILALLAQNIGKVVTYQTLLKRIWGPNSTEHVQYLRVHLGQVRKKLKDHGVEDLLVTESGVGYRLLLKSA